MDKIYQYYKILDLGPNASLGEVKKSYRDLVKVWHPDRFHNNQRLHKKANKKLIEINEAYKKIALHLSHKKQIIRDKIEGPGGSTCKDRPTRDDRNKYYKNFTQKKYRQPQSEFRKQQFKTIYNYELLAVFVAFILGAILSIIYLTYSYNDKRIVKPPPITSFLGEQKLQDQIEEEYQMDRAEYQE
jgi:DnaJ domain